MKIISVINKFSLRIFAVISAFMLWIYVLSSAQTKIEKPVTIHYILPTGYSIANKPVKEILYTIDGPRAIVRNLLSLDKHITINIKNMHNHQKDEYEIKVNNLGMGFPFGVDISSFEPRLIKVKLEKKIIKQIPIVLQTVGEIPNDHKMLQSTLVPKSISIEGPESIMNKYFEIKTLPVILDNITQSDTRKVTLYGIDERVTLSQTEVLFQFEVQPTRANLLIKNVPIRFLTSRIFTHANRRFVNLMVLAENGKMISEKKKQIEVIADIPPNAMGETLVKLNVKLPKGLHLLEVIPKQIKVFVKK